MNDIDVSKVDLNLLPALQALLSEGSVTRAARRLGLGQSAGSHALTRLRRLFGDPLFVRVGRQIVPTPRAEVLREPLARLLGQTALLLAQETAFDPARSTRSFVLACPDLLAPVLPSLVARLAAVAPRARLEIVLPRAGDGRALQEGAIDLALVPTPPEGPGLLRRGLGALRFAVAARRGHPLLRGPRLSRAAWAACPHVLVRTGHGGRSIVSAELARARFERRIGLVVPNFLLALVAVAESDLFFTAPRALMAPLCDRFALALRAPPVALAPVPVAALWHERFHADSAQRFFRALVTEQVAALLRGGGPHRPRAGASP